MEVSQKFPEWMVFFWENPTKMDDLGVHMLNLQTFLLSTPPFVYRGFSVATFNCQRVMAWPIQFQDLPMKRQIFDSYISLLEGTLLGTDWQGKFAGTPFLYLENDHLNQLRDMIIQKTQRHDHSFIQQLMGPMARAVLQQRHDHLKKHESIKLHYPVGLSEWSSENMCWRMTQVCPH